MSNINRKNKIKCPYCGNNPINHKLSYVLEILDIFFSPVLDRLEKLQNKYTEKIYDVVVGPCVYIFRKLGWWDFHRDINKSVSDRSRVIWNEAKKRGIPMEGITIFGKPIEQYRAKINGKWHYFDSLPFPPQLHQSRYSWMDDKGKLKKFLKRHKLPTAYGGYAASLSKALKIFSEGTPPFIVKPRLGSRGRHTTTHIYTKEELKKAFKIAQQLCQFVIVEEHLVGSVYRSTYVKGEAIGALRGDPPRIIGDGKHTINELIKIKNKKKHRKVKKVKVTNHLVQFLKRQNLKLSTIIPRGKEIDLSEKVGISYGGFAAEDARKVHPRILKYIKKAGDRLGAPVVGFDYIIEDITKDPDKQRWGIIEANSLPFIDLHHFPLQGQPINVAAKLWDLWSEGSKK